MTKLTKTYLNGFNDTSKEMWHDQHTGVTERGMFGTILSLPDNWSFSISGLSSILPDGIDKITNCLRKLEEIGYLSRNPLNDKGGKILEWEYNFSDAPIFKDEGLKLVAVRNKKFKINTNKDN